MKVLKLTVVASLLIATCLIPNLMAEEATKKDDEKSKPLSVWMQKKMEYSQAMLRGLVAGDLESVATKAEQMRAVSKVEGWIRGGKTGYRAQLQVFEFANNEILRNARSNNLEGTTLAFHQLTTACVSCHKMIREPNGVSGHSRSDEKSAE